MSHSDMEKTALEKVDSSSKSNEASLQLDKQREYVDTINGFTPEEQKKIMRKVDYRLVTTLGVLYCASLVDRANLSSAAIAGMLVDLNLLIGIRYSLISLIFFIPYVLFQPPATVVMRKLGPRIFLSVIVILWGSIVLAFGFAPDWTVMVGLRVILGTLEAGFFPGCAYLLSTWYPRYELQKRAAVWYLIGNMASALSGIVAYGIMQMSGDGGLAGWRWIFILEGIITMCGGVVGLLLIVDFPENASKSWRFLTERESTFVVARIQQDRDDALLEPFHLATYLKGALDLKVWGFAAIFGLTTTNTYAIAFFLPIILNDGLGFTVAQAQCLVAPPFALAAITMYIQAIYADKWRLRAPVIVFNACLGLIGLPLLGFASNNALRYFGVFLATTAGNANIPAVLTYQANNVRGQWKRALTSATLVAFGGIGGIVGSTIFRSQDSPQYRPGMIGVLLANALIVLITGLLSLKFWRANKKADAGGKIIEGQVGFRYTL